MKKSIFGKQAGFGIRAVSLSLLLLVLLVGLNVLVSVLPREYTVLDSSYNKLYTLSEATEKKIHALTEPVTIYFLCDSGTEDKAIRAFLDRYDGLGNYVDVKIVDPTANPTFTDKYTDLTLSNYSIIIEGGKRSIAIDYYDLYLWENEALGILTAEEYASAMSDSYGAYLLSYYPTVQHFNGEAKITNGIAYVAAERVPKLYATSNHGEAALDSAFLAKLKANSYDTVTGFSVLAYGGIPEDCDLLLINAPQSDLSLAEAEQIGDYLKKGGSILLTTDPSRNYSDATVITKDEAGAETTTVKPNDFPNLTSILSEHGLSAANGIVIETDPNLSYSKYPFVLLPKADAEHAVTAGAAGSTMVFYTAHGIRIEKGTKNATELFTTSNSAYTSVSKSTENYEKDENSETGPFALGVAAEAERGKLVWLSSASVLSEAVNTLVSGGNYNYAVSACNWLTDRGAELALPSVSLEEPMLVITGNTATLFAAFFCGVIPLSVLLGGLFYQRKRRKA